MIFVLFGIIQGLTEFLPISSSGHLYLLKRFLNISTELLPFFVFLHIATLLAICIFLIKEIKLLVCKKKLLLHILIITAVTAPLALIIKHFLQGLFDNKYLISFFFLVNAGILLIAPSTRGRRASESITFRDSLLLGILQAIAVLPGISRSGITITALLKRNFQGEEAFNLSFLMAIPIILGAFVYESKEITAAVNLSTIVWGFIFSFIFGLLALAILKRVVIRAKFKRFAYYCLLISLISFIR